MTVHTFEFDDINIAFPAMAALVAEKIYYKDRSLLLRSGRVGLTGDGDTWEWDGPVCTTYRKPAEKVLFCPVRDANPFYHFFETLWVLAGRNDVGYLTQFLPRIAQVSDDGETFHGAYGHRLRHRLSHDQISWVIRHLQRNPNSRRATLTIFSACHDHTDSKDIPCNTILSFLVRDGALGLTVFCRSNDMVWGAYGANVVQFSSILQLVAECLGLPIGSYTQISNSFHVYANEPTWKRIYEHYISRDLETFADRSRNTYRRKAVTACPFLSSEYYGKGRTALAWFDKTTEQFMHEEKAPIDSSPFWQVAGALRGAHILWKQKLATPAAIFQCLKATPHAMNDWVCAAAEWLERRAAKQTKEA